MAVVGNTRGPLPDGVWPMMITLFLNDAKKSVDWKGLDVDGWTVTETDDKNTRAREMR